MRLLLSGFEPFGGEDLNPSLEVVRSIAASPPAGVDLFELVLPVRPRISFERLLPAFDGADFDAWIGLGQAGGRSALSVERVGINLFVDAGARRPDETAAPREWRLVEHAADGYFARLPVREIAERIVASGVPATVSHSAGAYVCNEALFAMLHHLASRGGVAHAGFIHLPYLPEQLAGKPPGTPCLELESQVRGVRRAVEALVAMGERRQVGAPP